MALLASGSIGAAYLATEPERLDLRNEATTVADLSDLTAQLSSAIRDQETAVDDYLVSSEAATVASYRSAVERELQLAERIRLEAAKLAEVGAALTSLSEETAAWRRDFAERAISAVDSGSHAEIASIRQRMGTDQQPRLSGVGELIAGLRVAQDAIGRRDDALAQTRELASLFGVALMLLAAIASVWLVRRWVARPLDRLLSAAREVEAGGSVTFVAERDDEIGRLGQALEHMRLALQGDAQRSSVLNRFTEATTFAIDDTAVAASSLEAMRLLVDPDAAVTHVLNWSKDRAIPEATIGAAVADVLALNALSNCPAIVRGSIYVTGNASEPLSVHCPVYPVDHGTLACVPLAHGETVGAVHLFWEQPDAFPLALRASVARVAEHAALAIGNRRLLAALQGMASTDARTGLSNTRAFDTALEEALSARRDDESLAVLMLDIDHFKDFNDRYGHPAGDEALRVFADILRSCLRDGDLGARYGGEEFAVVLPGVDDPTALAIAERIRSRTEATLVTLAPGITDRISVSIGLAMAPQQGRDRVTLLRLADEALYRAKQAGRNRVEYLGAVEGTDAAQPEVTNPPRPSPVGRRGARRRTLRPTIAS